MLLKHATVIFVLWITALEISLFRAVGKWSPENIMNGSGEIVALYIILVYS